MEYLGTSSSKNIGIDNDKVYPVKKTILRLLALLVSIFFGNAVYLRLASLMEADNRVLMVITNLVLCGIFLYYAITGNRKPFFPKWVPFSPKEKDK
mgnify:CR=1 FL=1